MARIRTIKPSFFTSADVCGCSAEARLLFIGLWVEADRAGRVWDRPSQLRIRLFPTDPWDVDALLWELAEAGLIARMASDAGDYIQVLTFDAHQRPHPKEPPSAISPDGQRRTREAVEKHGEPWKETASRDQVVMLPVESRGKGREGNGDQEGKGMEGNGTVTLPAVVVMRSSLTSQMDPSWFVEFSSVYPEHRRQGGYAAQSAYVDAFKGVDDPQAHRERLLASVRLWATSEEWRSEPRFIPNITKWLAEEWWTRTPTPRAVPVSEQTKRTMAGAAAFLATED